MTEPNTKPKMTVKDLLESGIVGMLKDDIHKPDKKKVNLLKENTVCASCKGEKEYLMGEIEKLTRYETERMKEQKRQLVEKVKKEIKRLETEEDKNKDLWEDSRIDGSIKTLRWVLQEMKK